MRPSTVFVALVGALVATSITSTSARAQESAAPSFDVLKAAHSADSLRKATQKQRAEIARAERERRGLAEQIRRQQWLIDSLQQRMQVARTPEPTAKRVDVPVTAPAAAVAPAPPGRPGPAGPPATPAPSGPPATPAPLAQPAAAVQPAAPAPKQSTPAPPQAPNAVAGFGSIVFDGLLQVWMAGGDAGYRNTYRIRRTELKLSGDVTPHARWTVMADLAKSLAVTSTVTTVEGKSVVTQVTPAQNSRVLQDALITLTYVPHVAIDVGQQKIPLGLEGQASSGALDVVERALLASDRSRGGTFGDIRDIGAVARAPLSTIADAQLGLFDGSGEVQNDVDKNVGKALIGRLVLHPSLLGGLRIGTSGVWAGSPHPDQPRRDRFGGELSFRRGRVLVQSEVIGGHDGDVPRRGFYAHTGVRVSPLVEVIARFDSWDPDTRQESTAADATERDYIAGANMPLVGNNVKLQLELLRKTYSHDLVPARMLGLLNVQASW